MVVILTEEFEEADFPQNRVRLFNKTELGKNIEELARVKPSEKKRDETRDSTSLWSQEIICYQHGRLGHTTTDSPYVNCRLAEFCG